MPKAQPNEASTVRHKPYPTYRHSGVEWLQEIPAHWKPVRSKRLFTLRNLRAKPSDRQLTVSQVYGVIPQDEFVSLEGRRVVEVITGADILKRVEPNDFVISMRSFQGGIEWSKCGGAVSSAYVVLAPTSHVDHHYFSFLLKSSPYIQALQSTSNLVRDGQALRYENFSAVDLPLLPISEQRAIATYLARQTGRINALIAKKARFVDLLQEKRTALISRAVTKGLDPDVPMKDSGVEWLGEIPTHWNATRIRHLICRIEQGWSPDCENRRAEQDEWGVLKAGCVNRGIFNESEHKALPTSFEPIRAFEIREGDLLMSRASGSRELVGSVAIVPRCRPRLLLCDKIFRLHLKAGLAVERFIAYSMNSRVIRAQIGVALSGGSGLANNIAQEVVKDLMLAQPPHYEQHVIGDHLDRETTKIDRLVAKVIDAIDRLRELRTALISAGVTGKIDVRREKKPFRAC